MSEQQEMESNPELLTSFLCFNYQSVLLYDQESSFQELQIFLKTPEQWMNGTVSPYALR